VKLCSYSLHFLTVYVWYEMHCLSALVFAPFFTAPRPRGVEMLVYKESTSMEKIKVCEGTERGFNFLTKVKVSLM